MNMELVRQHEAYKSARARLWSGQNEPVKPLKRVVMRMPEWMTRETHFDDHMKG